MEKSHKMQEKESKGEMMKEGGIALEESNYLENSLFGSLLIIGKLGMNE